MVPPIEVSEAIGPEQFAARGEQDEFVLCKVGELSGCATPLQISRGGVQAVMQIAEFAHGKP